MNAPAISFVAELEAVANGADAGELRRAALLLHTVSADDRAWLLARVDGADRLRLQGLVDELRALGIPPAPELLDELDTAATSQRVARGGLQNAGAAELAGVLAAEPAELIARLIALGPWPWTGALLARLGESQRRRVMDGLAAPEHPPCAFDARLIALVEARLAQRRSETRPSQPATAAANGQKAGSWLWRWLGAGGAPGTAGGEYRG